MEHIETATPLAFTEPTAIEVRGARVHNLKNLSLDVPLRQLVGIAGVSGSGKSSLALGVLYAEGSRRYLEALSTYTRRRISQAGRATVDEVLHVPAALALRQRPGIPGVHSTFGTSTELLNYLRLMFSRLGCHVCPNGHVNAPTLNVAAELPITCSTCGVEFYGPSAEDLAFNSGGACPTCGGTGVVRDIDESTLIADPNLTLEEGAVAPWRNLMWSLMPQVAREMGVRIDVPYKDLTDAEKDIVLHGPMEKRHILYVPKNKDHATELDFTYYSAVNTVRNALAKAKDEKGMARVAKFLCESVCPDCHGTRLSEKARSSTIDGRNLAQVTALSLDELREWLPGVAPWLPPEMRPMCDSITSEMTEPIQRLEQLGLGYLTLDRASETLSNGERQRVALTRAVRSRTTGVLYVLDEPSIGLHQRDNERLIATLERLRDLGNTVIVVEHDEDTIRSADFVVDMGPGAGEHGGHVIAAGTPAEVMATEGSVTADYLSGRRRIAVPETRRKPGRGTLKMTGAKENNLNNVTLEVPIGTLTVVTGVSGSGKSSLITDTLAPALANRLNHAHRRTGPYRKITGLEKLDKVINIDQSPIGRTPRSNPATYIGLWDDIRALFASTAEAKARGYAPGRFSFNVSGGRCEACKGDGQIKIEMHFLPDVYVPCEVCHGTRYNRETLQVRYKGKNIADVLDMRVEDALEFFDSIPAIKNKLQTLYDVGLGYIKLGQSATTLSGGEAQRVKLSTELSKRSTGKTVYLLDEPTTGLHTADVEKLIKILQRLVASGNTVIVIEHNLDIIKVADNVIDLGPEGGNGGGSLVAQGTPEQVANVKGSYTGRFLNAVLEK